MDPERALYELAVRRKVTSRIALDRIWSEARSQGLSFELLLRPRIDPVDFMELIRARDKARLREVLDRARPGMADPALDDGYLLPPEPYQAAPPDPYGPPTQPEPPPDEPYGGADPYRRW